jgi:glycerophosphoryl diester phosphodiesterase
MYQFAKLCCFLRQYVFLPYAQAMASGSKRPKENTVESFTLAQRLGASWIETDVQFTRDGVPVIEHDFEVQTTDGDVIDLRELSLCELEEVKGEVLQLDDALDRSPEGLAFNLELKYRPDVPPSATALEGEIETLLNVAEQQIKKRRIAYSSFAQEPLAVLSRMQAMWPVFALASRAGGGAESVENALDSAKRNGLSGIVGNVRMLQAEPSLVSMIKAEGLLLMSYGEANTDPSVLPEQVRWGVCGVITDDVPIVEEVSRKLAPPLKK